MRHYRSNPQATWLACIALSLSFSTALFSAQKWEVTEVNIDAPTAASYTKKERYRDIRVVGRFSRQSSNAEVDIEGFWDGGTKWRFRFNPTKTGNWDWETLPAPAGSPTLSDLHSQFGGTIAVSAAPLGATGFLRSDRFNYPHHFIFDNGEHFLMMGNTYYEIIKNALDNDVKWRQAIDKSKAYGINKIRMLTFPWQVAVEDNSYPDAIPFSNGNHDKIKVGYWQRMDDVVEYLEQQNVIAELIFFPDQDRAFGTNVQDQRYVDYIVARYAAYPNVIWCLANEWNRTTNEPDTGPNVVTPPKTTQFWKNLGNQVKQADPWMNKGARRRPLSIHGSEKGQDDSPPFEGIEFRFFDQGWAKTAVLQYGIGGGDDYLSGDEWGFWSIETNSDEAHEDLPVVNDEHLYIGQMTRTDLRRTIWGVAMGAGYQSIGDWRDKANGRVALSSDWHYNATYSDVRNFVDFWTPLPIAGGFYWWQMTRANQLVNNTPHVYVLTSPNGDWNVVYAAEGGQFTIYPESGEWWETRYDPRTGVGSIIKIHSVGSSGLTINLQSSDDWVVMVSRHLALPL